jgi:thiol-disulfide isomerase/thioredoxin
MALRSRTLLASLDMYRKIPADLLEGTKRGSVLSVVSLFIMLILMVLETKSYLRTRIVTELALFNSSSSKGQKIILNFNITMLDLKCDFISMDQVSVFGALQNVNQHIRTRTIDQYGIRRPYSSTASSASLKILLDRNSNTSSGDLKLYDPTVTETLQELTKDGENAIRLSQDTFSKVIQKHRFVFVDFFADWCSHCRDLAPTWEKLAKILNVASVDIAKQRLFSQKDELEHESPQFLEGKDQKRLQHAEEDVFQLPVLIAKVDCMEHHDFCRNQNIVAYPTIQLFVNGKKYGGDYYGHRTVLDFTDYLATIEEEELAASGEAKRGSGDLSKAHLIAQQIRRKEIGAYASALVGENDDVEGYYRSETALLPEEEQGSFSSNRKLYDNKIHKEWVQKDHPGKLHSFLFQPILTKPLLCFQLSPLLFS